MQSPLHRPSPPAPEATMPLRQMRLDDILILMPGPKLTATASAEELSEAVNLGIQGQTRKFLFDFSEVEFIDSLGVGQIVASYRMITEAGGRLILCGLNARVQTVLRMANLHLVLDIREKTSGELRWEG